MTNVAKLNFSLGEVSRCCAIASWITNGGGADTLVVYAKTDPDAGPKGITAFIIAKGFKGLSFGSKARHARLQHLSGVEDCEVRAENVLGKVGDGVRILMSGLDYERAVISGGPLGIMAACMDVVIPYVHDRKQFGQPIDEFQLMHPFSMPPRRRPGWPGTAASGLKGAT